MSDEELMFEMNPEVEPIGEAVRVPPGDYRMELAEGSSVEQNEKSGNYYMSLRFRLREALSPVTDMPTEALGQMMFFNVVMLKDRKKQGYWRRAWEALGLPWGGAVSRAEVERALADAAGVEVLAAIKDKEYQGKTNSRIDSIRAL